MSMPVESYQGPALIGTMINIFLHGIMVTQVYIYYTTYKRDSISIKIFVLVLLLIDTINTVFEIIRIYMCLITHFGDVQYSAVANWIAVMAAVSTGVITLMAQLFYAWRIHVLTRNWALVAVVVLLSVTSVVFATVSIWETLAKLLQANTLLEIKDAGIVWFACAAAADIVITAILVWHLVRYISYSSKVWQLNHIQRRHRSGFQKTDMMINRIIRVTIQTGLLTAVVVTLDLIIYLCIPSGIHIAFMLILCKLYSNSLISSLNSRGGWKYDNAATPECEINEVHWESNLTGGGRVDIVASQPPTVKPETSLDSMISGNTRQGVSIHVASHEMQDVEA